VAELADALDSKFRNERFYLINCHQMPFTIFIGKISFLAAVAVRIEGPPQEGRK
jgi:hypothetical protein